MHYIKSLLLAGLLAGHLSTDAYSQSFDDLQVDFETTFVSKYVWRGYEIFDDHGATQPSLTIFDDKTGLSVNIWGAIPIGSGGDNINALQEYDYTISYGYSFLEESTWQIDTSLSYIYYDFPKLNSSADTQEVGLSIELPNILKIGPGSLAPAFYIGSLWPSDSGLKDDNGDNADIAGFYYSAALNYGFEIVKDVPMTVFGQIDFNDGIFANDSEFTHATFGISTEWVYKKFTISPFINYQITMDTDLEETNGDDHELYGGLTFSFSF
ncbi:MAG: hypothetical protein JEZ07_11760 [Phycisphaerae bacterium]|nr:hypothetical protein [Phycisphaerae bacterium]